MSKKEDMKKVAEELGEISVKLDKLTSLFRMAFNEQIEKTINTYLMTSDIKRAIYELCDGGNTPKKIAKELNKTISFIRTYLSRMEKEGIIVKKGLKYYAVK